MNLHTARRRRDRVPSPLASAFRRALVVLAALVVVLVAPSPPPVSASGVGTTVDGRFAGAGLVRAGSVLRFEVTGRGGVPAVGVEAVVLNVVATEPRAAGYVTVFRCDGPRPLAASVNVDAGATVGNSVVAGVDASGDVCVFSLVSTHVVIDVSGWFGSGSGYRSVQPARLVDSRPSTPAATADDWSRLLLDEYRAGAGVGALTLDPALTAYAADWSREMARSGLRHGSYPGLAENIAWTGAPSLTPRQVAEQFHLLWVRSAPHRVNMLNAGYTHVGIGFHRDASGWYATHVFR